MNKKIIIGIVIAVAIIIIGIIGGICYKNSKNNVDSEVIEIINNLNNGSGYYGDWKTGLHITRINKVKKIDVKLYNKLDDNEDKLDESSKIFIMDLEEKFYGNVEIIVVNGEVTANSILGETYDELWNKDIFTKDKINIEKINEEIK